MLPAYESWKKYAQPTTLRAPEASSVENQRWRRFPQTELISFHVKGIHYYGLFTVVLGRKTLCESSMSKRAIKSRQCCSSLSLSSRMSSTQNWIHYAWKSLHKVFFLIRRGMWTYSHRFDDDLLKIDFGKDLFTCKFGVDILKIADWMADIDGGFKGFDYFFLLHRIIV